jgi:hypothetical protein
MNSYFVRVRDELAYLGSIVLILVSFLVAMGYMIITISINTARISDLAGIEAAIQTSAAQIAKNPTGNDAIAFKNALSDLNAQKNGKQKEIDYGQQEKWHLGFKECLFLFSADCFHRNSSAMNTLYLSIAGGILGICLSFFIAARKDASSPEPVLKTQSPLISIVFLIPMGAIIGLLTLFLLRGAKGAVLSPVADVVQVESPFGVAFACIFAAFFSDRILAGLGRLADHFGFVK